MKETEKENQQKEMTVNVQVLEKEGLIVVPNEKIKLTVFLSVEGAS